MAYLYNAKPTKNIIRFTKKTQSLDDLYDVLASRWAERVEARMKKQRLKIQRKEFRRMVRH